MRRQLPKTRPNRLPFLEELSMSSLEQVFLPSVAGPVWATRVVWSHRGHRGATDRSLETVVVDN